MLGQRQRQWANSKTALVQYLMFAGYISIRRELLRDIKVAQWIKHLTGKIVRI